MVRLYCPTPSKRRYATEPVATDAAAHTGAKLGVEMESYHCPCDEWHIRSVEKARNTQERHRRKGARSSYGRPWLPWEDDLVMSDIGTSVLVGMLDRSATAIQNRHRRLRTAGNG
jgi:hypothetical protein